MSSKRSQAAKPRPTPGSRRPRDSGDKRNILATIACRTGWIPILGAAFLGVFYVKTFGVNVPWAEDWFTVQLLQGQAAGTLTWSDLWAQYNEHRLLISRLIVMGIGNLTHLNLLCFMYASVALLMAVVLIVVLVFRRQVRSRYALWLIAPAALLMFSWRQSESFLLGFQLVWVWSLFLMIGLFAILHIGDCRRRIWPFVLAAGTAMAATFTVAHGLFAWPLGFGQILLLPLERRRKTVLMSIWAGLCAVAALVYFHGYVRADLLPPPGMAPDALWNFFPILVGLSLTADVATAQTLGFVILGFAALAIVLVVRARQWSQYSFWLTTMAFSLMSLAAITAFRSKSGLEFALPQRYTTMSILLVVSAYAILVSLAPDRASKGLSRAGGALLGCLMLICLYPADLSAYRDGEGIREFRRNQAFVLCTVDEQPDEAIRIGIGEPRYARDGSVFLKERRYSVYAPGGLCERFGPRNPNLPTARGTTEFRIENIGPTAGGYVFSGWAVDTAGGSAAGGVYLVLDGKEYPAYYGIERTDIAAAQHNDRMVSCGFQRLIPAKNLASGRHAVALRILSADRRAVYEPSETFGFEIPY